MKNQTKAIHTPFARKDPFGAISMPVYNTVAYEFDDAQEMSDAFCYRKLSPDYSRAENPTVDYLEDKVKAITGAHDVIALNSGMAAISNIFLALTATGKNIVSSRHMFGNTYALINGSMKRFGVTAKLCDLTNIEEVEQTIDENSCCVFLETLTNPQLEVADLSALAEVAHRHGIPLIADSTMIPFTENHLGSLGVDIEVLSSTKYISGGATSLGGLIIDYGTVKDFNLTIRREMLLSFGAYMTPQVAYMQTVGLENLNARDRLQAANALELAKRLRELPQIKRVNYVGLEDNPYHALSVKQFGPTGGCMLTIDLESKEACYKWLNNLKMVRRATNLFDNKTLAIHTASTIFGGFSDELRRSMDLRDTTIRLSVGLEDVDDILADMKQAFE